MISLGETSIPPSHRFENVGRDLRKIGSRHASRFRFVNWLVFLAARERANRACAQATSDSSETESITSGWQQCLHRATRDTFLVNLVARKFQGSRLLDQNLSLRGPYLHAVSRRMVKVATDFSELPIHRDNLIESGAGN